MNEKAAELTWNIKGVFKMADIKGIPPSIQEPEPFDKVVLLTGRLSSDEMHNLWAYIRTLEKEVERLNNIIKEQHEQKES